MKKFSKKQFALLSLAIILLIFSFFAYKQGLFLLTLKYTDKEHGFSINYPIGWENDNGQCKNLFCAYFTGPRQRKNSKWCETSSYPATLLVEKIPARYGIFQLTKNGVPQYAENFGLLETLEYKEGKLFISPGVGASPACWGARYYVFVMLNNGETWTIKLDWDRKNIAAAKQIFTSLVVEP